jgi:hypothetical protein
MNDVIHTTVKIFALDLNLVYYITTSELFEPKEGFECMADNVTITVTDEKGVKKDIDPKVGEVLGQTLDETTAKMRVIVEDWIKKNLMPDAKQELVFKEVGHVNTHTTRGK